MLQRQKLEDQCINFLNTELKEVIDKYQNIKYRQYLKEDSRIVEINKQINIAYKRTFLCLPLSMEIAKNYSILIENLLLKKNSAKLEYELKNANLSAITFQYDNYHALGDKENYNFFVKKFRKLVDEYQVSPFKKIEFELDILIKKMKKIYISKKKIIDIIKSLSEIMYADFVKKNMHLMFFI